MTLLDTNRGLTDPNGRCFVSYRRTHVDDVALIVDAMLDVGVPPWQDRRDLMSQPLGPALEEALNSPETSGALVWISDDIQESPTILELEAPRILGRNRSDPEFCVELWLADGLNHGRAREVFRPAGVLEDVSASWNLERARTETRALADGTHVQRIGPLEAARVAARLLERRLAAIHRRLPQDAPIRLNLNAHASAGEAFAPGFGIQINWARHFEHRFATPQVWSERLLPALGLVLSAVRAAAPGRGIAAEGYATLAACLAFGRVFREVGGIPLTWTQRPAHAVWSLSEAELASGFHAQPLRRVHIGAHDLAVFVSVTGDVEPAVTATPRLPAFQAVISIRPSDGSARRELSQPGQATHVARLVSQSIRDARHVLRTVERTHLFIAGPAGLAVMIGQQLNALGPIHTYEHEQFNAVGTYRPAVILSDPEGST